MNKSLYSNGQLFNKRSSNKQKPRLNVDLDKESALEKVVSAKLKSSAYLTRVS
jgi:hypothetical protein